MATHAHDDMKHADRDILTAVATASVPGLITKATHLNSLLTPPNSISPGLPPRRHRPRSSPLAPPTNLDPIESDLELQDNRPPNVSSRGFDTAGDITSNLLATHHLPSILLNHGPLAIRHIMGYLTTSVPGFAGIPPSKARRLVVGALEGKGEGKGYGGLDGSVTFEKVGWGSWDARLRGQPPRQVSPNANEYSAGMPIKDATIRDRSQMAQSWAADSIAFSHSDDVDMPLHEADKMSLDDDETASSSDPPSGDDLNMDDIDEMTDDEDWAAMGAAALREQSFKAASVMSANRRPSVYNSSSYTITHHGGIAKPQFNYRSSSYQRPPPAFKHTFPASKHIAVPSPQQERDAVEALLRLGSV